MKEFVVTKPINPSELTNEVLKERLIDEVTRQINYNILNSNWHNQFSGPKSENYTAVILAPFGRFTKVMDEVVVRFQKEGWNCCWSEAYDARGPHQCFYVNKTHFK